MNRYRAMTYVLVVSNIIMLVAMFIAAFWGFTYPKIVVDGYESGKSAFVAAFMCCLAGICLCGLNFQNYYLLVTYAILHILIMLNQLFSLLPFTWTRIPNYPLTGSVSTQVYVMLLPKLVLVTFAFALAYKLRRDEKRYELARTGGLHQRLPCHIVPRGAANDPTAGMVGAMGVSGGARCQSAPLNAASTMYGGAVDHRTPGYGTNDRSAAVISSNNQMVVGGGGQPPPHLNQLRMIPPSGPPPPPTIGSTSSAVGQTLPPPPTLPSSSTTSTNQIIQTPPIYPLHRPSVTDVSIINSPMVAPSSAICHRPIPVPANCPPPTSHHAPSSVRIGNHSTSCGGLDDISMLHNEQQTIDNQLSRIPGSGRSSVIHWRTNPYQSATIGGGGGGGIAPMTPTKQWWPNSAKQQQYSPYYRDVYNPNF